MPEGHPSAVAGVFHRPFTEQVAFFRRKLRNLVPTARWDDLEPEAHDDAFMVAGAAKADLLNDLAAAVDKAIAEGRGIEEFRKDFRAIVARNGWTGWTGEGSTKGEAWRVKTILRTNAYTSYAAGRMAQLREGGFKYWVYRHGGSLEPRVMHLSWNGLYLPADDPAWAKLYPPNDWGCSCYVVGARTEAGAKRLGGDPGKKLLPGWEAGLGKGWNYAPGASVSAKVSDLAKKIEKWPALIGAGFGASIRRETDVAWKSWLERARAGKFNDPGFVGVLDADDIVALGSRGAEPASAEIYMRPGLVHGPKAARHEAKGDALPADVLENLPALLRAPRAVLIDERSGKLIFILGAKPGGRTPQLAVELDYWIKSEKKREQVNMVVSAYTIADADIINRVRAGDVTLIRGQF